MWESVKTTAKDILLYNKYFDFAWIKVMTKQKNNGLPYYEVTIFIDEVLNETLEVYKMDDIKNILEISKEWIEDLYEEIIDMHKDEILSWKDDFLDALNDY